MVYPYFDWYPLLSSSHPINLHAHDLDSINLHYTHWMIYTLHFDWPPLYTSINLHSLALLNSELQSTPPWFNLQFDHHPHQSTSSLIKLSLDPPPILLTSSLIYVCFNQLFLQPTYHLINEPFNHSLPPFWLVSASIILFLINLSFDKPLHLHFN